MAEPASAAWRDHFRAEIVVRSRLLLRDKQAVGLSVPGDRPEIDQAVHTEGRQQCLGFDMGATRRALEPARTLRRLAGTPDPSR